MEKIEIPIVGLLICEPNLDMVVESLQSAKNDTINYYFDFFSHRLFSDTVTVENAYEEVYGCTKEEYKQKMLENYRKHEEAKKTIFEEKRRENLECKNKYRKIASEVFPSDKMYMFDKVIELLDTYHLSLDLIEARFNAYIEVIRELNKEDFSLNKAEKLFNSVKGIHSFENMNLLFTIKEIAIHGDKLYDLLFDSKLYEKINSNKIEVPSLANDFLKEEYFSEEEKAEYYDREVTTLTLGLYHFTKSMDKNKTR